MITESTTVGVGTDITTFAYQREFVANQPGVIPSGQPIMWQTYTNYEDLSSTNTIEEAGYYGDGYMIVKWPLAGNTLQVRAGDWLRVIDLVDGWRQIMRVFPPETGFDLVVLVDLGYFGGGGTDKPTRIYYGNRTSRLRPTVFYNAANSSQTITPQFAATTVVPANGSTTPVMWVPFDVGAMAQLMFEGGAPDSLLAGGPRQFMAQPQATYGLRDGVEQLATGYYVLNTLEVPPYVQVPGFTDNVWIMNNILNGKPVRNTWCFGDGLTADNPTVIYVSSVFENVVSTFAEWYQTFPQRLNQVGPEQFWVTWKSRYGGWNLWCFNYDQTITVKTKSYGSARVGYDIIDLGKMPSTTYKLNTGTVSGEYVEWFEDLQRANEVYFTRSVATMQIAGVTFIDLPECAWVACSVEDMGFITSTANSSLVDFQPTLKAITIGKSYRS